MRKLTVLLVSLVVFAAAATAQKSSLKGSIRDTLNKQNLSNATIAILRAKDSVLVKFTRTDAQGNFELKNLSSGDFILMVSYPTYAEYVEKIKLDGTDKSLGSLPLITKANLLQEVIVKQRIGAIRVKGDTTEYRADSFRVSANADVQELLRKMPGIQVNSKGEITAQGEKVEKILVDGEEFFSDDPAVVTKNLRADAVDKVQAFDKKSDQATFTGIDDGQKIKTLNIQLKEDKKKGYFGKVELGSDFTKYNYGKALLNAFKGKRKISGYLTSDNTKFESLNWDENRNYAGDANTTTTINDDGGISIFSSGDEFSWGRGFPKSITGGLHFSNKWNQDKHNTNNTYQYNDLNVHGTTITKTESLIPNNQYTTLSSQSQVADRTRHKLTSIYEWQIDSSSSLKITAKPQTVKSLVKTDYITNNYDSAAHLRNTNKRLTSSNDENNTLTGNIFWRKKFKKAGRTISFNSDLSFGDRKESLLSVQDVTYFSAGGGVDSLKNIDQMKVNKQRTSSINSLLTYTEPLWKNTFLILNYRLNLSQNNSERNTFGKNGAGKYENLVDTLSNHYIFNTTGHQGGFNIRYNVKKVNFSVGTGLGTSTYHMTDLNKNTAREVTFTNFVPSVQFNYTPKQQRRVTLNYTGSTRNPTLQQIQPLTDNTDQFNQVIGNPDLKQSFTHNFNFRASDYKVLKSKSMSIYANLSITENAISNASFVDQKTFAKVSKAINVSGNYNFNASLGYGFDLVPSLNVGLNAGPSFSRYVNYVNNKENRTSNKGVNIGVYSGYWADKWINFWMNFNANYSNSVSSIRPEITTAYWQYNTYSNVQLKLKKMKTYIDIGIQGTIYQKTEAFANQLDSWVISPSIRQIISKDDKWELKVAVNDMLNQNRGINRSASSNFRTETVNETIQRYVLFSLVYNFSKNGKPANSGF
ncbi:outer membrane beta-barrel protein [Sediminibacterium roseum]|uniref:Outer membrane beta-barrel protein n=1 Tax=Sediminibacterium roseum TaxID=1978412 RepID=A0ABW9ZXC5_9BACT|nr:outer membrane beta-barrel protein [Sediminibacterium roseum]NCI51180.1 outer membrane beta-barrel protein [Sediminibacterium roseum]